MEIRSDSDQTIDFLNINHVTNASISISLLRIKFPLSVFAKQESTKQHCVFWVLVHQAKAHCILKRKFSIQISIK